MRKYIIRRLLLMPVTLLGITFLVFFLTRMVPGGPVDRVLQEQMMAGMNGDGGSAVATGTGVSDEDIERLEELFNLQEPVWKSYLQWLGIRRREVDISKAEFDAENCAYLTLAGADGAAHVLEVRRDGAHAIYLKEPWLKETHWRLRLESPRARAERKAHREGVTDEKLIAEWAEKLPWRARAYHKRYAGLLQGDLGLSYKYGEPVAGMIAEHLPVSLYFGVLGAIITYIVSIPLGVYKALRHNGLFDGLTSVLIFAGYAVPGFALGALLLVYLGARMEWFPLYGLTSTGFEYMSFGQQVADLFMHTVLPLSCYVISSFAMTTMMMKNSLMEHLSADYIRTAVAKGVPFRKAVWRHAFRNSVIPVATSLGGVLAGMVAGSMLIERVFDIQGFGMLSYQALIDKDYSLIMGTLLVTSVMIIIGNLIADVVVACIDPRIKYE